MVRKLLKVTISGNLDPVIRKRLAEVVQLVQSYCRLAELEIAAGERPRTGEVALSNDTAKKATEWAEDEAERKKQREAFMGRLRAVGKDPRAAMDRSVAIPSRASRIEPNEEQHARAHYHVEQRGKPSSAG